MQRLHDFPSRNRISDFTAKDDWQLVLQVYTLSPSVKPGFLKYDLRFSSALESSAYLKLTYIVACSVKPTIIWMIDWLNRKIKHHVRAWFSRNWTLVCKIECWAIKNEKKSSHDYNCRLIATTKFVTKTVALPNLNSFLFIHSFVRAFIHWFTYLFIYLFIACLPVCFFFSIGFFKITASALYQRKLLLTSEDLNICKYI